MSLTMVFYYTMWGTWLFYQTLYSEQNVIKDHFKFGGADLDSMFPSPRSVA